MTSSAAPVVLTSGKNAVVTGIHEIGHAALNSSALTGQKLSHITIIGGVADGQQYYGYALYTPLEIRSNPNKASVIAQIAKSYAGSKAQEIYGTEVDSGWAGDLESIKEVVGRAILKYGFEKELLGVEYDSEKNPLFTREQREFYEAKKLEYIRMGEAVASFVLRDNWQVIRDASAVLVKKGYLTGEEFEKMTAKADLPGAVKRAVDNVILGTLERSSKKIPMCGATLSTLTLLPL